MIAAVEALDVPETDAITGRLGFITI